MQSGCPEVAGHSINSLLDRLGKPSVYWLGSRVQVYLLPNHELPETGVLSGLINGVAGSLLVTSNAQGSPQVAVLTGSGVQPGSTTSTTTLGLSPNPVNSGTSRHSDCHRFPPSSAWLSTPQCRLRQALCFSAHNFWQPPAPRVR